MTKNEQFLLALILLMGSSFFLIVTIFGDANNYANYKNDVDWELSASMDLYTRCILGYFTNFTVTDDQDGVIVVELPNDSTYPFFDQDIYDISNCFQDYVVDSERTYNEFNVVYEIPSENKLLVLNTQNMKDIGSNKMTFQEFEKLYNSAGELNE